MPKLFVGNFDFEYQLGPKPVSQLPQKLRDLNRRLLPELLPLTRPGDFVWSFDETPAISEQATAAYEVQVVHSTSAISGDRTVELVPWGWTRPLIDWGTQQQWTINAPPLTTIAHANSRVTSAKLERDWNSGPTTIAIIHAPDDVQAALQQIPAADSDSGVQVDADWVIKSEFGMSSRERLLGKGTTLSIPQQNWIDKRLRRGERLVLEPWLPRIAERSFHFDISQQGGVRPLGAVTLLTDAAGRYLKNESLANGDASTFADEWEQAAETTRRAAEFLAAAGYFGPLSIDSMVYATGSSTGVRPLQDLNARWSMGRCELERSARPPE